MKNFYKLNRLFLALVLGVTAPFVAKAQIGPVLELDYLSVIPPAGPNTNPITVPFSLDPVNDNTYGPMTNPLSITLSLQDQRFTGLPYSNISTGLVFGGGSNLSSGGITQMSASNIPFDLLGTYSSNGGPKSYMFTTHPEADSTFAGTGMDVDGDSFKVNQNGGFQLFTAAQVLYDSNYVKDARVYFGELKISFSNPVKNPVIHFAGLGGSYSFLPFGDIDIASNYKSTFFTTELELVNTNVTSTLLSSNSLMDLVGNNLYNNYSKPNGNSTQITGEYPIDNYGAMTGSVLLTGVVKDVIYKVYLKGSPLSDINWSTDGYNPALPQPQLVTGATRDPFTGDIWWVSASLLNPTQQISGNVFLDADALENNNIATTGTVNNPKTNIGGQLYANLVDAADVVVATMPINSEGAYLFDSVAQGTYKVLLSTLPSTIGATLTSSTLPPNWENTGERITLTAGDDGTADGISAIITVGPEDRITEVNFGIQQIPNSDPKVQTIPSPEVNIIPQSTATNAVSGIDPEDGVLGNPQTIRIKVLPTNANMFYNNIPVVVGTEITNFDPALLSYTGITSGSTSVIFEYAFIDRAKAEDPTPATYELNWLIPMSISGIELRGQVEKLANDLDWEIIGDVKDLDHLELYRSVNNSGNKMIAKIEVAGNKYQYKDLDITANSISNYYVIAIEQNGKQKLSNVVSLKRKGNNDVQIYPNPVQDLFTIEFTLETAGATTATILDATGKTVLRVEIAPGTTIAQLDIEALASGVYTLNIDNEVLGQRVLQLIKK